MKIFLAFASFVLFSCNGYEGESINKRTVSETSVESQGFMDNIIEQKGGTILEEQIMELPADQHGFGLTSTSITCPSQAQTKATGAGSDVVSTGMAWGLVGSGLQNFGNHPNEFFRYKYRVRCDYDRSMYGDSISKVSLWSGPIYNYCYRSNLTSLTAGTNSFQCYSW